MVLIQFLIPTSAAMTTGRLSGTAATPMAVRAWLPISGPNTF
jgi:hypothetical protein